MNQLPALHPNQAAFAGIRRNKGLYVDKTPWFRQLLEVADSGVVPGVEPALRNTHQFLARPRRFGKSLLVDTLEIWFQGLPPGHLSNSAGETGDWDELPAGWTSPVWLWEGLDAGNWHGVHGWHPVIRLDMSRAASPDPADTRHALQRYLEELVDLWAWRGMPWSTPDWVPPTSDDSPADILFDVIEGLGRHYGRRPVVLVDEYDAPITKHIGTDRDLQPTVEALQDCYRILKDDQGLLYCVFLTGITRFARGHLFSAANNLTDISELPRYGALCGFTEAEVAHDLEPYREALAALEPRFQDRDILGAWRDQYNGYRFAPFPSTPHVYNPFTLIHGLDRTLKEADLRSLAVAGHWPSAWSESGHPRLAARLAADMRQSLPGTMWEGGLPPLPAPGLGNLARPDYSRLMLDTGYYTWHGGTNDLPAHLNFPNREVAESWVFDILNVKEFAPERDGRLVRDLRACLERGDVPGFARRLETFAFGLARENLQSEASFRTLLQSLFLQMAEPTQSEKSTQGGRADHEIRIGGRVYVFEVKYNRPVAQARNQIRDRQYGREHLDAGLTVTAVALAYRHDLSDGPRLECRFDELAALLAERGQGTRSEPAEAGQDRYEGDLVKQGEPLMQRMNDREKLRQRFNRAFARWEIELPADALSPGVVWQIVQRGWTIWTRFDIGADDGREYLDYYAMHRMTNDRHVRLYADGDREDLPAMPGYYSYPQDATEAEREEVRRKHFAHNQAVEELLDEKGFVMTDQAHGSARVNRYLQTHPDTKG